MFTRVLSLSLLLLVLQGCRIIQIVDEGGVISSRTGNNDCPENQTCIIDVENGTVFSDTFTASPAQGYIFAGWKLGLCAYQVGPCVLEGIPGNFTAVDADLDLAPTFVQPQPMHQLNNTFTLGGTFGVAAVGYGVSQADLDLQAESPDTFVASNDCFVNTIVLSRESAVWPDIFPSGNCSATAQYSVPARGKFGYVQPPVTVGDTQVQERRTVIDMAALKQDSNAFSSSVATTGTSNSVNGFNSTGWTQNFIAEKSNNSSIEDLAGEWAFVRLLVEVDPTRQVLYSALSFPATINTDAGGQLALNADTQFTEIEVEQSLTGGPVRIDSFGSSSEGEDFTLPLSLSAQGELFIDAGESDDPGRGSEIIAGFVTPSADFLVLSEGVPAVHDLRQGEPSIPAVDNFSVHQLFLGLKRNQNPDLAGKTYRLEGLRFTVRDDRFELVNWAPTAQLAFGDAGNGDWRFDNNALRIALANRDGEGVIEVSDRGTIGFDYTVESGGRILFDLGALEGVDRDLVHGYASQDSSVLIFAHVLSIDNGAEAEVGMWVAYCTNCE
jgi:hypothetical protein